MPRHIRISAYPRNAQVSKRPNTKQKRPSIWQKRPTNSGISKPCVIVTCRPPTICKKGALRQNKPTLLSDRDTQGGGGHRGRGGAEGEPVAAAWKAWADAAAATHELFVDGAFRECAELRSSRCVLRCAHRVRILHSGGRRARHTDEVHTLHTRARMSRTPTRRRDTGGLSFIRSTSTNCMCDRTRTLSDRAWICLRCAGQLLQQQHAVSPTASPKQVPWPSSAENKH